MKNCSAFSHSVILLEVVYGLLFFSFVPSETEPAFFSSDVYWPHIHFKLSTALHCGVWLLHLHAYQPCFQEMLPRFSKYVIIPLTDVCFMFWRKELSIPDSHQNQLCGKFPFCPLICPPT